MGNRERGRGARLRSAVFLASSPTPRSESLLTVAADAVHHRAPSASPPSALAHCLPSSRGPAGRWFSTRQFSRPRRPALLLCRPARRRSPGPGRSCCPHGRTRWPRARQASILAQAGGNSATGRRRPQAPPSPWCAAIHSTGLCLCALLDYYYSPIARGLAD